MTESLYPSDRTCEDRQRPPWRGGGQIPDRYAAVFEAIVAARNPRTALNWLRGSVGAGVRAEVTTARIPLSRDALDAHPQHRAAGLGIAPRQLTQVSLDLGQGQKRAYSHKSDYKRRACPGRRVCARRAHRRRRGRLRAAHRPASKVAQTAGQLTPTLKPRRHVIMEQYANQIAALYDDRAS